MFVRCMYVSIYVVFCTRYVPISFYHNFAALDLTFVVFVTIQELVEDAQLRVIAVRSRSSTKVVVITVVPE